MKKSYLTLVALLMTYISFSQTYEQWGVTSIGSDWDTTYNYGEYSEFDFTGMPIGAHGTASLIIYQDGDFGDNGEYCEAFDLNSMTSLGTTSNNPMGDCTLDSMVVNFGAVNLDAWQSSGTWSLRIGTSSMVDFFCGDNGDQCRVKVRLIYNYCSFGTPVEYAAIDADTNMICPHSSLTLTGTPSGGTFTGTGVTGNTFSGVGLTSGNYTVTYTATDGIGCETSANYNIKVLKTPGDLSYLVCEGGNSPVIAPASTIFAYSQDIDFNSPIDTMAGYSYGPVTQSPEVIYYANFVLNDKFVLDTVKQDNSYVIDHDAVTYDDRGGIAITDSTVYIVGDDYTGRYDLDLLNPGVQLPIRDGLFSDIKQRKLWSLYNITNDEMPYDWPTDFVVEAIVALDEDLNPTSEVITLSSPITMGNSNNQNNGIFAGYGKVGLYNGDTEDFFVVDIASGTVENTINIYLDLYWEENWADWGTLSFDGIDYIANYRTSNSYQIVAHNLTDDIVTDISSFSDVSDMGTFIYHPVNERVYFHYEGSGQFGGSSETLGYVDASATIVENPNGTIGCPAEIEMTFNSIDLGNDTTVCQYNTPLVLEAGFGYNSYTWNGVNNDWNVYPVSTSGTYTVVAVDDANCNVTDQIVVTVDECAGLNEDQLAQLSVYPNPNNGEFTVQVPSNLAEGTMSVMDLNGRVVIEEAFNNTSNGIEINVKGVENGMYIVRIATNDAQYQTQIVVQK